MPSAIYYGKKGNGKGVLAVTAIREYLLNNRPVATNLNIKIEKLLPLHAKQCTLYRLPDYPVASDLWTIGVGNRTMGNVTTDKYGEVIYENPIYDEDENGLIVLDELSAFLNSREWKGAGRNEFLHYLIHTRKLGWDTIFISQDPMQVDAQIRGSQIEHFVHCIRGTNVHIPFISKLYEFLRLKKIFPKHFIGYQRFGANPQAHTQKKLHGWATKNLMLSYDTRQIFQEGERVTVDGKESIIPTPAIHTVLPPYYTIGRYKRLLPRWALILFSMSLLASVFYLFYAVYASAYQKPPQPKLTKQQNQSIQTKVTQPIDEPQLNLATGYLFNGSTIQLITPLGNQTVTKQDTTHHKTKLITNEGYYYEIFN